MCTTTSVDALAVPLNVGVRLLVGDGGWLSDTVGGSVSTVNVLAVLSPSGFPSRLSSFATAVYVCSPAAVRRRERRRSTRSRRWRSCSRSRLRLCLRRLWTTTFEFSLAEPLNVGVRFFDSDAGWFSDTLGASVSTANVLVALSPSAFPSRLSSFATAVYVVTRRQFRGHHGPSARRRCRRGGRAPGCAFVDRHDDLRVFACSPAERRLAVVRRAMAAGSGSPSAAACRP